MQRGASCWRRPARCSAAVAVATSELKLARARQQAAEGRLPELKQAAARYAQAVRAGAAQPQLADDAQYVCATPSPTWRWPRPRRRSRSSAWNRPGRIAAARAARAGGRRDRGRDGPAGRTPGSGRPGPDAAARTPADRAPNSIPPTSPGARGHARHGGVRHGLGGGRPLPSAKLVRISPIYGNGRLQDDAQRGPVRGRVHPGIRRPGRGDRRPKRESDFP